MDRGSCPSVTLLHPNMRGLVSSSQACLTTVSTWQPTGHLLLPAASLSVSSTDDEDATLQQAHSCSSSLRTATWPDNMSPGILLHTIEIIGTY